MSFYENTLIAKQDLPKTEITKIKEKYNDIINNNSGKANTIYHVWYMNGELIAKVRIRVAKGEGVSSFSHRDIGDTDKGTWKVEITDSDKKILDTIIFELV